MWRKNICAFYGFMVWVHSAHFQLKYGGRPDSKRACAADDRRTVCIAYLR